MIAVFAQTIRYGFFGIRGFLGVVVGLVFCLIAVWGLWAIFDILMKKFSNEGNAWLWQILRIILIVITAWWFISTIFSLFPF